MVVDVGALKKKLEDVKSMEFPEGDANREFQHSLEECDGCDRWLNGWMQGIEDAVEFIERLILEEGK